MAKTPDELNRLEQPQSRDEQFLSHICGRATDPNLLPAPESRIEEYLEYIALNGGVGGQAPSEYIKSASYDSNTEKLTLTNQDNTSIEVDLVPYVKGWEELENTNKYPYANLLDYSSRILNQVFNDNTTGSLIGSTSWDSVYVNVQADTEYTMLRKHNDSNRIVFFREDGSHISTNSDAFTNGGGWHKKIFTTPTGCVKIGVSISKTMSNINRHQAMVIVGNLSTYDGQHIPFADGNKIQIGKEISLGFNNANSNLSSTTVESVIKELNIKVDGHVKADEDNVFTGINTFDEIIIRETDYYVGENLQYSGIAGGTKKTGRRDFTSHSNGNDGFVKSLFVRVSDGLAIGNTTLATVWAVTKNDDISQETITKIVDNQSCKVFEEVGYGRYIEVLINMQFDEETYFVFQLDPSSDMAYANITNENAIYINNTGELTTDLIEANKDARTVGMYWLVGKDINIKASLEGKVNVSDLTTTSVANKVPQLNEQGKLDSTMFEIMTEPEATDIINGLN